MPARVVIIGEMAGADARGGAMARLLMSLTVALAMPAQRYCEDAHTTDLERLQGAWTVIADRDATEHRLGGDAIGTLVIIHGDQYHRFPVGAPIIVRTLRLDSTKIPRHIDLTYRDPVGKDWVFEGIFDLHGDIFRLCLGEPGRQRPTEFRLGADSSAAKIITYQRKNQ
jgi:uncharacterized protein (TIGR03067 family)